MKTFAVGTTAAVVGYRVVRRVEAGAKSRPCPAGPGRSPIVIVRVADGAVRADLRLVVAAGVLAVGDVDHVLAVALHVVAERQARHDPVSVSTPTMPPVDIAAHVLVARRRDPPTSGCRSPSDPARRTSWLSTLSTAPRPPGSSSI